MAINHMALPIFVQISNYLMNNNLHLVIMAGGTGTRFWPYSRQEKPKQFLDILGTGKSLLQMTSERFAGLIDPENHIIVSNERYETHLKKQFPSFKKQQFLLEPTKRNTAPCIAYAAYKMREQDPQAIMVVSPADHAIFQENRFLEVVEKAVAAAADGKLITIGIKPNKPETGYGYIQYIESDDDVKKVKTFTEKPELELAEKFLESGDFVWNAGIFVWSVQSIIDAIEKYEPEMAEIFGEGTKHYNSRKEKKFIQGAYSQCRNISIDYAVMEKADNVHMVMGDFDWSDLGSWGAVYDIREKDKGKNILAGDVVTYNSTGNFVHIGDNKLAIIEDLHDYLVADFEDVLVICRKEDSSRFRDYVKEAKKKRGDQLI